MEDEHARIHIMNDSNNPKFEEEEEEALSLCDLPLNHNSTRKCNSFDENSSKKSLQPSLPDATEFFEFFNGFSNSDMCPASDIIFCGKLVPFKDKDQPPLTDQPHNHKNLIKEANKLPIHRRRSESLSSVTRSNSVRTCTSSRRLMMRNSRSLDYRGLHESSSSLISPALKVDRNFPARSVVPSENVVKKAMKPRWYALMFGTVKVPQEMELHDMKNRQVRRNSSTTMFPATDAGGKVAVNRSSGKVSWRILKALSCKDHNSVAATTSFALPQAS